MAQRIGRDTTRAEDAPGTPTPSHVSPSILVYEEYTGNLWTGLHLGFGIQDSGFGIRVSVLG